MNKTASSITIALLVGVIIGMLVATGSSGVTAQQPGGSGNLGNHHQHLTVTLGPGERYLFENPKPGVPVYITVSRADGTGTAAGVFSGPTTHFTIPEGHCVSLPRLHPRVTRDFRFLG